MANSPRPGVWALEKSNDGGQSWQPWYYFAGNDAECQKYFGMHANDKIVRDDQVTIPTARCSGSSRCTTCPSASRLFVSRSSPRSCRLKMEKSMFL